jgi:TBC1 domain family member 2
VEADVYWCVSKMIESVTSNYTQGFDGLRQAYSKVEELLLRIDQELYEHFRKEKIDLFALSFRNISTMLLRLFSPNVGIRLFDTYISYEGSYPELMVFLFIAIVEKFAKKLLTCRFEELMAFLQNLPTKKWTGSDL